MCFLSKKRTLTENYVFRLWFYYYDFFFMYYVTFARSIAPINEVPPFICNEEVCQSKAFMLLTLLLFTTSSCGQLYISAEPEALFFSKTFHKQFSFIFLLSIASY